MFKNAAVFQECPSSVAPEVPQEVEFGRQFAESRKSSHDHGDAEDDDDTRIISLPQRASLSVWLEENGRTRKEWEKEMEWENEMEREGEWEIKWERRGTETTLYDMEM
ncbi:hypothetical protein ACFX12_014851 [Malus domestica]